MQPTWPGVDMITPNGTIDPLRVVNLFKYSYAINAPAGFGIIIHNTIRTAQIGSCIGVLAGLTQSRTIPNLGVYASHGGRIGGLLGLSLVLGKTIIDESMNPFGIDEMSRKLKENSADEKMTLTTLTFSMLGAGAAYSGRKMGALEGGFLGIAGGTLFYFVGEYMKEVIDREVQKGREERRQKQR